MELQQLREQIKLTVHPKQLLPQTHLRSQGKGHEIGLCPLHGERTPSFHIWTKDGEPARWRCFGCGQGGDVIDLAMQLLRCSHAEAIKQLTELAGLHQEKPVREEGKLINRSRALWEGPEGRVHLVKDRFGIIRGKLSEDGKGEDPLGVFGPQLWHGPQQKAYIVNNIDQLWELLKTGKPTAYIYGTEAQWSRSLKEWGINKAAIITPSPRQKLRLLDPIAKANLHLLAVRYERIDQSGAYFDEHTLLLEELPKEPAALAQKIYQIKKRLDGENPFDEQAQQLRIQISQKTGVSLKAIEGILLHGPDPARVIIGKSKDHTGKHVAELRGLAAKWNLDLVSLTKGIDPNILNQYPQAANQTAAKNAAQALQAAKDIAQWLQKHHPKTSSETSHTDSD